MTFDDELRRRLHETADGSDVRLDADAVRTEARRRRRPKVAGIGVLAVAACALVVTPVVIQTLPQQSASTADAGAAPEIQPDAGAPGDSSSDESQEGQPGASDAPATGSPATEAPIATDEASALALDACQAQPLESGYLHLTAVLQGEVTDGQATITFANDSFDELINVPLDAVGMATIDASGAVIDADVPVMGELPVIDAISLMPGATQTVTVPIQAPTHTTCEGAGEPVSTVPLLRIAVFGGSQLLTGTVR